MLRRQRPARREGSSGEAESHWAAAPRAGSALPPGRLVAAGAPLATAADGGSDGVLGFGGV